MNEAGGVLKVSPDGGLLQSSTVANMVNPFLYRHVLELIFFPSPVLESKEDTYFCPTTKALYPQIFH